MTLKQKTAKLRRAAQRLGRATTYCDSKSCEICWGGYVTSLADAKKIRKRAIPSLRKYGTVSQYTAMDGTPCVTVKYRKGK